MASRRRPRPVEAMSRPIPPPSEHSTKRRRGAAAVAVAATTYDTLPWSSMHGDLVSLIAERVLLAGDLLDYVRFRAACRHWRACTLDPRGRGVADPRFHPRRWMMLPEGHGLRPGHAKLRGVVRFFNRDTGAFVAPRLPLLKDHCILDCPDGLLLLQRDADTAARLLHPFTGDVCELPPLPSLIPQLDRLTDHQPRLEADEHRVQSFRRLTAAVAVAPTAGTVTVLLALEHICRFANASAGDRRWTLASWSDNRVARTLGLHVSLYLACWDHEESTILRLVPPPLVDNDGVELAPPQAIAKVPSKLMILPELVERDSEILVVGSTDICRSHLVVARLSDLLSGEPATPLASIGEYCLFFGMRSLAVSSRGLPSVACNSIVLYSSISNRLMQYNLGDDTLSPACDGDIVKSPPASPPGPSLSLGGPGAKYKVEALYY